MLRSVRFSLVIFFCTQATNLLFGQAPVIQSATSADTIVGLYEKFEAIASLNAAYNNPYDYDQVVLYATVTSPSGNVFDVDGFFMQDYTINNSNGALTQTGNGAFRLRFAPGETGTWSYTLHLTDVNGSDTAEAMTFECIDSGNALNKGFVRTGHTNYLQFDNGDQYIPVGENMAWQNSNVLLNFTDWIDGLYENGGNFFRLWHAHWGLGIEWLAGSNNFAGLRRYKQTNSKYQDWLFDYCADRGVYVMDCLQHHGQVSSNVNPNWNESPYNAANGGPCVNTWDFFTHPAALDHTKNRLRYVVARWGYARSIMAWELFNEVDWTDEFETRRDAVANWHSIMAAYLKEIDPYDRLVTTSYAREVYDSTVWNNPNMDFAQIHYYINTGHLERALVGGTKRYLEQFEKPTLIGEFGLGGTASLAQADPDGIHIHNSMWGSLFGGGLGTGMTWWWDNYIHPLDLYYHFKPVSEIAALVDFIKKDLRPVQSMVIGAPGDLMMTPVLGWGDLADEAIMIHPNGTFTPENPELSAFLYGSQWNTQYKRAPTFTVTYPQQGLFTVTTGSETGTSPKIAIWVDGNLMLDLVATVSSEYSVIIPAGAHEIKVDNIGTDWITIQSYTFQHVGSQLDAYVLSGSQKNYAAGWVLNTSYNHLSIEEEGIPDAVSGAILIVEDFNSGNYQVHWYDCETGDQLEMETVSVTNDQLSLSIPNVLWDLAFVLKSESVGLADVYIEQTLSVFPNPAMPDEILTIQNRNGIISKGRISILDVHGQVIAVAGTNTNADVQIAVPRNIPTGFYWIQISTEHWNGAAPFVVLDVR